MSLSYTLNASARTQRFGSGGARILARDAAGLSLDEIVRHVPAVAATAAHDSRSAKFVPIPTLKLIEQLQIEGFRPFEARQGGSRVEGKRDFTKHMIRFRHPDMAKMDGLFPEVILINANDGTAAYQIMSGLFRTVCTNGLIAGTMFQDHRVSHTGEPRRLIENVIEASFSVVSETAAVVDSAAAMAATPLSQDRRLALANAARVLRWAPDEAGNTTAPIPAEALLKPRRAADTGQDLWATFNVVQENLLKGGQSYVRSGPNVRRRELRHVGAVNSIDADKNLNRALWTLAEALRQAA